MKNQLFAYKISMNVSKWEQNPGRADAHERGSGDGMAEIRRHYGVGYRNKGLFSIACPEFCPSYALNVFMFGE
ncbi:MAG: hypothetical protein ACP5O7_12535 [Phycisphaerae bacterium]